MKQLHKQTSSNQYQMATAHSPTYSTKPAKQHTAAHRFPSSFPRSILSYLFREQRILFVLVGALIATSFFLLHPSLSRLSSHHDMHPHLVVPVSHISSPATFTDGDGGGMRVPNVLKKPGLRIVVTGGAGFVGSHLVDKLLGRGDSVIVVDNFFTGRKENLVHHFGNSRFELIRHDVVEPILLEVDQIYHLACPASPVHYKYNPIKTIKTNVMGTLNMLGLAKRIGARFLLTSTSEVYGDPLEHPQKETYWGHVNPIGVRSCYDEGKRTAETLTMDYHRGAGVEVDGLVALMESKHTGPFNLGNPGEFTMLELAQVVKETIDPSATIEFKSNTADDPHMRKPDITKAKQLLNWEPKIALRQGLPLMVSDFQSRILDEK